ncbi:hypothetical protein CK203_109793 [Vitis vinifera]|uniref:Uncharacterized protein n=1 Tax=Vitis vinifera TaxID=29760 RepID=A0A438FE36_VITVI|nr:hypothetical protein CK203_109793 [Vitis vinifera]
MLTQPPIEGNLDCELDHFTLSCALTQPPSNCGRSLQIHSTYCADIAWSICCPKRFLLSQRARHIAEALHIPYEPSHFEDYRVWTSSQLEMHWTQRRGVLLEALFRISEGYFFGPHHLIMAALLYFEEKVHKKKLQRADAIPLLFPRLCQILEHLELSSQSPQPAEIPAARRASPDHIPEDPDCVSEQPCLGDGSYSSSPGADVDHLGSAHCILRQLQHHLGLPSAAEHLTPTTAVPHSQATQPQAPPESATEEAEPSA